MTDTLDWARARPVLERLLALPEAEREAALARECEGDDELREGVRRLLAAGRLHKDALEPLVAPGPESSREVADGDAVFAPGDSIGAWRLEQRLGAGGMGEVWRVTREGTDFRQRGALKVIKRGMDTEALLARFRRERRVLAELEHPNIPRLLDGGATEDGRPCFVMEYVEGVAVDVYARERGLDVPARLRLFLRICEALQHAHEHGVVHRDLKPSNVLVASDGEPKLLDFGIAKVLAASAAAESLDLTLTGQQLLTPRYASPEQLRGEPVTAATDVYALGLILWELLVGRPAVQLDGLTQADLREALCERALPRPSLAVEPNATGLRRALAGDLDTICAMALRKEPERRYAGVKPLADDVRRHLDGQRVLARPDTVTYRVSKFVRRNRLLVGATLAVIVALALGLVVALLQTRNARRAERAAERTAYAACLEAAEAALGNGDVFTARERLDAAHERLRGWEWRHLASRLDTSVVSVPLLDSGSLAALAWTGAGGTWAYSDRHDLILRDEHGERWRIAEAEPVSLSFAPGSNRLAWCDRFGGVWVLDLAGDPSSRRCWIEREPVPEHPHAYSGIDVAWSPDERWLAFSHRDGLRILDGATGELLLTFPDEPRESSNRVRWHPGGELLAKARWQETVEVYDVARGVHAGGWRAHTMSVADLDFDATGERLVTCSLDRTVKVWDFATRRELAVLQRERAWSRVRFLPGGEQLAGGEETGAIALVDWRRNELVTRFLGLVQVIVLAVADDGRRIAAIDLVGSALKVWDIETRDVRSARTCEFVNSIRPSPDGRRFVTAAPDGYVRVWRTDTCTLEREAHLDRGYVFDADWSPDGKFIATAHQRHGAALWNADDLSLVRVLEDEAGSETNAAVFAPDGSALTTAHSGDTSVRLRIWSLRPGVADAVVPGPARRGSRQLPMSLVTRTGGSPLAIGTRGESPPVWNERGELRWASEATDVACWAVAATPDRRVLALAYVDEVVLVDGETLAVLQRWPIAARPWNAVALHPDGRRIALTSEELIEIWDPWIPLRLVTLHGHQGRVADVAWTPDGSTLLSVSGDGVVRVWATR